MKAILLIFNDSFRIHTSPFLFFFRKMGLIVVLELGQFRLDLSASDIIP